MPAFYRARCPRFTALVVRVLPRSLSVFYRARWPRFTALVVCDLPRSLATAFIYLVSYEFPKFSLTLSDYVTSVLLDWFYLLNVIRPVLKKVTLLKKISN